MSKNGIVRPKLKENFNSVTLVIEQLIQDSSKEDSKVFMCVSVVKYVVTCVTVCKGRDGVLEAGSTKQL
jgi:hypothetical protein